MRIDIYFATNRLSISTTSLGGYEIAPDPECGIDRSKLLILFVKHHTVTLLVNSDEEARAVYDTFLKQFTPVLAAGGVVQRMDRSILMIFRNGRWDLPKGHWEEGETIEECAVREVMEESGVSGLKVKGEICKTLNAYYLRGVWELKETHWYAMQSSHTAPLTPQADEGIELAEWLSFNEIKRSVSDSYPTIIEVLRGFYSNENLCETNLTL